MGMGTPGHTEALAPEPGARGVAVSSFLGCRPCSLWSGQHPSQHRCDLSPSQTAAQYFGGASAGRTTSPSPCPSASSC